MDFGDLIRNMSPIIAIFVILYMAFSIMGISADNIYYAIAICVGYIAFSSILAYLLFKVNPLEPIEPRGRARDRNILSLAGMITPILLFMTVNIPELFNFAIIYFAFVVYSLVNVNAGNTFPLKFKLDRKTVLSMMIPLLAFPFLLLYQIRGSVVLMSSSIVKDPTIAILAVGIIAPISEEIFFRGVELFHFSKGKSIILASILSALLFSVFHALVYQSNMFAFFYLFMLGYGMSLAVLIAENLLPAVVVHLMNNILATV